jgi:MFS family permease
VPTPAYPRWKANSGLPRDLQRRHLQDLRVLLSGSPLALYWGYFIFEAPSNLIMEKVGARLWIARIMIAWGLLAGATALVTGSTSFAAVRFLGVAEAGFFPGIILYFTYWFPSHHHARIVSGFLIGNPSLRSVRRSASSAAARLSSRRPAVARTSAKSPRNGV